MNGLPKVLAQNKDGIKNKKFRFSSLSGTLFSQQYTTSQI